ncbi:MAG TPA: acyltransferase [Stellaceae bacterium]|nr:acyltransferase [Stellaceae bacterium]
MADRTELPGLTPLRGIAALAVVFFHVDNLAAHWAGGSMGIWTRGYLAVDLFFMLSGFVLSHVYGERLHNRNWRELRQFFWARACRLYPAGVFTTTILLLVYAETQLNARTKTELIAAFFQVQIPWFSELHINPPSWSVSAEVYAYLLFPFILWCMPRLRRSGMIVLVLMLLAEIAFTAADRRTGWEGGWRALVRALPEFVVGIFAYRAYRNATFERFWRHDITLISTLGAIILALMIGLPDGPIVILLLALLLSTVSNSGILAAPINARPLRWMGDISYSVYIFQIVPEVLAVRVSGVFVRHGLGGMWFESFAILLVLASGILVHRCVDVPIRHILRAIPGMIATKKAATSAP